MRLRTQDFCYVLEEPRDVREQDISEKSSRVRYKARNKSVTTSSYPFNYCLFILVIHCWQLIRLKIKLGIS